MERHYKHHEAGKEEKRSYFALALSDDARFAAHGRIKRDSPTATERDSL